MTLTCTIAGTPVELRADTLQIDPTINGSDVLYAEVVSETGSYRPANNAAIVITQDGTKVFGGTIITTKEVGVGGMPITAIVTQISAVSYKALVDDYFVTETVADGTALETFLNTLDTNYFTDIGITLSGTQPTGPNLPEMQFDNVPLATVFTKVGEVTNYWWNIDPDKVMSMRAIGTAAPFNVSVGNNIDGDLQVERSNRDYANRIVLIAGQPGIRDYVDTFTGDGSEDTWTLSFPIVGPIPYTDSENAVGNAVIDISGGTESLAGTTAPAGFIWEYDPAGPTITRRTGAVTNGVTFTIRYQAQWPFTVTANDLTAQGTDGYIKTRTYVDVDITSKAQAEARAQELLEMALAEEVIVEWSTRTPGLIPGMGLTVNIAARNVNATFNVQDVLITNDIGPSALRHRVRAFGGSLLRQSYGKELIKSWLGGGISVSASVPEVAGSGGVAVPPEYAIQFNRGGQFSGSDQLLADPLASGADYGVNAMPAVLTALQANDSQLAFAFGSKSRGIDKALTGWDLSGDFLIEHGDGNLYITNSTGEIGLTGGGELVLAVGTIASEAILTNGLTAMNGIAVLTSRVTATTHTVDSSSTSVVACVIVDPTANCTVSLPALSSFRVSPITDRKRLLWVVNDSPTYTVTIDPDSTESVFVRGVAQSTYVLTPGQSVCLTARTGTDAGWKVISTHGGGPASAALGTGAITGLLHPIGRNSSGSGAAGALVLYSAAGTPYYVWVDATGDLRIHTAAPTEDGTTVSDTAGTVVGTQS
jgi:hypothetical protein